MKLVVFLTMLFPIIAVAAAAPAGGDVRPDFSKYRSTIQDPDVQQIKSSMRRLRGMAVQARGGNVSGGGEDTIPLSIADRAANGAALEAFQLGLIGVSNNISTNDRSRIAIGQNRVAVVDSGLVRDARTARNIVHFEDFTGTCARGEMCDQSMHGTLVADLVGQVAPTAELVILKVLSGNEHGKFSPVVDALKWLNRNHKRFDIRIVNLSLVSPDHLSGFWDDVDEAKALVKNLHASGVLVVSAVGNDFKKSVGVFPADATESITVGSYSHDTSTYRPSPFSNFGYAEEQSVTHFKIPLLYERTTRAPKAWHFKPEVLAPGEGLFACTEIQNCFLVTGTSFASALVSGGLHSLLTKSPVLTRDQFVSAISDRCPQPMINGDSNAKSCAARFDLEK